ncbi:MAG: hypothetical protein LQ338_000976 [Usnochroma carphineum]|nr:MAG: hypothetical protein LQ338_000976 [Usnochroma carphineum]
MAPPLASAKLTLSYPLYASDFDPQNSNFLLVGGGGGESRTGLGNKITLINTSRKQTISEVVEINLSTEEDSVTSLAVASSTPSSVTVFAGINSSQKDQNAGKNEHLRSFRLEYPPRRTVDGEGSKDGVIQEYKGQTAPLGRASLFKPSTASKKETYQRITRLSRPCKVNGGQLGAIATGLAPEGEIVLFDAKTNGPMGPWVEARISTGKEEAGDLDIVGLDDAEDSPPATFAVAYCTDYMVHAFRMTLKQNAPPEPHLAYSEPHPDTFSRTKARPKFRSLRFITPHLLLLLQIRPNRSGADLLLLELSPHFQGRILSQQRLHSGIKSATALSVTHLPCSGSSQLSQHVIAVAGQDTSISIFHLEHPQKPPFRSLKIQPHTILRSVHPLQITSLSFSTFLTSPEPQQSTPPQYIKLASTSVANTIVVHTLPLLPYPPPSSKSPRQRYVLTSPGRSDSAQNTISIAMAALAMVLGILLLQAFTEIRGGTPEYLGVKGWLPRRVHDLIAVPYLLGNHTNTSHVPTILPSDSSSSAASAISSLSNRASPAASSANEQVTGALSDTPQKAKEAVSSALDAASSAASELSDASAAYSATASSTVSSASSTVSSAAFSVTTLASHKYNHIRDLLSRHHHHRRHETPPSDHPIPHMIIHDNDGTGDLRAGFLHEGRGEAGRRFEELRREEKEVWKRRLQEAGVWAVEEGEAVLKGVFFGGVAQAVGRAAG